MAAAPARTIRDAPELAAVQEGAPETYAAIVTAQDACFRALDPSLLELLALRVAQMIHGADGPPRVAEHADPRKVAAVGDYADPVFSGQERACLAFAEQFVVSVRDVDDELVDAVLEHLEPADLFALVNALYLFDATERLDAAARRIFPATELTT